jgi:hypothetical protein
VLTEQAEPTLTTAQASNERKQKMSLITVEVAGQFSLVRFEDGRYAVIHTATGEVMADHESTGAKGGKLKVKERAQDRLNMWHYLCEIVHSGEYSHYADPDSNYANRK